MSIGPRAAEQGVLLAAASGRAVVVQAILLWCAFLAAVAAAVFAKMAADEMKKTADATADAAKAADRSAKVAEHAVLDLERPIVFARFRKSGFEIRTVEKKHPNGDIEVAFHSRFHERLELLYVNFGRSPAILKDSLVIFDRVGGRSTMPYPIDPVTQRGPAFPVGTITAKDDPHGISKFASIAFNQGPLEASALMEDRFFCLGYLRYDDVLGGTHVVGFCAYYDWIERRFVSEGGPAYNYVRTEVDARKLKD